MDEYSAACSYMETWPRVAQYAGRAGHDAFARVHTLACCCCCCCCFRCTQHTPPLCPNPRPTSDTSTLSAQGGGGGGFGKVLLLAGLAGGGYYAYANGLLPDSLASGAAGFAVSVALGGGGGALAVVASISFMCARVSSAQIHPRRNLSNLLPTNTHTTQHTHPSARPKAAPARRDYAAVRKAIEGVLDADDYDDGSYGPVLVRLAWHSAGTYDAKTRTGGSNGATMRFAPESEHGANAGLAVARALLEPVKAKFPWISYADLWTLAGAVAIEAMGGPAIPWQPGRSDAPDASHCPPDGRLPDATQGAAHLRDVFGRMGFDDKEIVALSGAHTLGRCHADRSGFVGPWTNAPTTFSNLYFQELTGNAWRKKRWSGPLQYEDKSGQLMMLPTDMALVWDKRFKPHVAAYAADEELFFRDFAAAFGKLLALGVPGQQQA